MYLKNSILIILTFLTLCSSQNKNIKKKTKHSKIKDSKKKQKQEAQQIKKLSKLDYQSKIKLLQQEITRNKSKVVKKNSNHIFGLKKIKNCNKVHLKHFNKILDFDTKNNTITVESAVRIKEILSFLVPKGYMLPIIPDMSHLTIGGIIAGVGGGSASFKNGTFHDNVIEFEIVTGEGKVWKCSKDKNIELFYSIPNSLGTLGYITKLKLKVIQSRPYVYTENHIFTSPEGFFRALEKYSEDEEIDFLDGTIFSNKFFVLIIGKLLNKPNKSLDNFINNKLYWKSIQTEKKHCFKLLDYIYRWDTDLYYTTMSDKIPKWIKKPFVRKFFPKWSVKHVKKLMASKITVDASRIVQDILIPFKSMREFFAWYDNNINLYPIYICPAKGLDPNFKFWTDEKLCDFGIGYGVTTNSPDKKTKEIEKKMIELKGKKLLYARHQMSEDEFWKIYDKNEYERLREKYHANDKFFDIYTKIKK